MEISTAQKDKIQIFNSWKEVLLPEFQKPYMQNLREFLKTELQAKKMIYPRARDTFAALNLTPVEDVKVVILGQDPYHGPGQAHGLSFSVVDGVRLPPSLQNIYKEIATDIGVKPPMSGDLTRWAKQGVLLLNATLTVEGGLAGSHQKRGWETFTDAIIKHINDHCQHVVFILWGSYAQKKAAFIDRSKHFVIESVHPSPLSSHRGFFGSRPFSKANAYLTSKGITPIQW